MKKNITIRLDKFGQAKYLNDCILHELREGNNQIYVNIEDSFSGSNVCAPIAGIIDYHREKGVKIHVNCPRGRQYEMTPPVVKRGFTCHT